MKTNPRFFSLLFIVLMLNACRDAEISPPPADPCADLVSGTPPVYNQFVIRVHDTVEIKEERLYELIPESLKKLQLFDKDPGIQIMEVCMCRMILISTDYPPGIDMEETAQEARSRLQAQGGSPLIADVGANVNISVRPNPGPPKPQYDKPDSVPDLRVEKKDPTGQIVVAIIDTGVDLNKPEISQRLWVNTGDAFDGNDDDGNCLVDDFQGYNFAGDDQLIFDLDGHGTHVNGIIAMGLDPGLPILLMNLKISEQGDADLFDAVCAIHYAIDNGAKIMNLSWGFYGAESSLLTDALTRAKDKEILVVTSTGNDNSDNDKCPHWPSNTPLDNIIAVSALDTFSLPKRLADYSNYGGAMVDISAPGTLVKSYFTAIPPDPANTVLLSGTSMAAAHVSRRAAEIWAIDPSGLTYLQVKDNIMNNLLPLDVVNKPTASDKWSQ